MATQSGLTQELRRHARRRRDGIPTVSVLVGAPDRVLSELERCGIPVVTTREAGAREMARAYLARLPTAGLREQALAALGLSSAEWDHKSPAERALALEGVRSRPLAAGPTLASQWLQAHEEEIASEPLEQLALILHWRAPEELPLLVLRGAPSLLAQAVALAESAAPLAVAFVVEPEALSAALNAQAPRVRAMLADAVIRLDTSAVGVAPTRTPQVARAASGSFAESDAAHAAGIDATSEEPWPASDAAKEALASPALSRLRDEARRVQRAAREDDASDEVRDRARSMVERFLFQLLQSSARTRDLFELNARLPFRFGARALEADFAARELRLVLEVDGYFHFTDRDAYRRDRRKDVLLQQHGYLVARVLAEDVLERTAAVVGMIEQLVSARRPRSDAQEA